MLEVRGLLINSFRPVAVGQNGLERVPASFAHGAAVCSGSAVDVPTMSAVVVSVPTAAAALLGREAAVGVWAGASERALEAESGSI